MSRFLSLKKQKAVEKHELNKADDNIKDKDYGSITSLINNEVSLCNNVNLFSKISE